MTSRAEAERRILLSYAPASSRAGLAALFALDQALADVLRSTREPMIGQMRLTWWHDRLTALDTAPAPTQPVLQGLSDHVVRVVPGRTLAMLVDGWEELLEQGPLDRAAMERYAAARGGGLFAAAGCVLQADGADPLASAGRGWALADLAAHLADPAQATEAAELAAPLLDAATRTRWSRRTRPLGAMVHLARLRDAGPARRMVRALLHRVTGI